MNKKTQEEMDRFWAGLSYDERAAILDAAYWSLDDFEPSMVIGDTQRELLEYSDMTLKEARKLRRRLLTEYYGVET